jgi:hypothetical protein
MVRDPWTFAAAFAIGFIGWILLAGPQKNAPRLDTTQSLNADPRLRLISEGSEYMRTER